MTRNEELKKYVEKLQEKQKALRLAAQDFEAHKNAFDAWLKAELNLDPEKNEYIVPELIMLWSEKNDQPPQP